MKDILNEEIIDLDEVFADNIIKLEIEIHKDDNIVTIDNGICGSAYDYDDIRDIIEALTNYLVINVEEQLWYFTIDFTV